MIELAAGPLTAQVSIIGAALNGLWCPDKHGKPANIILGYPDEPQRRNGTVYAGQIVGPIANRLAGGVAERDGISVRLPANDRGNALHGGPMGTSMHDWTVLQHTDDRVLLGLQWNQKWYPGKLELTAEYVLDPKGLEITLTATTDEPTFVALAPHPYLNLAGSGRIDGHLLAINADEYLPVDDLGLPTPEAPVPVRGITDYRQARQLALAIDNSYVISDAHALTLVEPGSLRRLRVETNQPCIQVYTGDYLEGNFAPRQGVAIEPQAHPNAANRPDFPGITLMPSETYENWSRWQIDTI